EYSERQSLGRQRFQHRPYADVIAAVPHEDQPAVVQQRPDLFLNLVFKRLRLFSRVLRRQPMVSVQLDHKGAGARGTNEAGQRLVLDDKGPSLREQIQSVSDQISKFRSDEYVEPPALESRQRGKARVTETWKPAVAQRLDLPLAFLSLQEELVHNVAVRRGGALRVIVREDLLRPGIQILAVWGAKVAETRQPVVPYQAGSIRNAGRDGTPRA